MATFAERLTELRNEKGMSQDAISTELGVSKNSIYYYENEKRVPDANTVIKFARFFNVTSDYLLGLEDSRTHDGQAVFEKLKLSDKAMQVLIDNNTVIERFYRDNAFSRNHLILNKGYEKARLEDSAYARLINAILEKESKWLAIYFNELTDVLCLPDTVIDGDEDASGEIPNWEKDMGAGYMSYRCMKEFMKFLDDYEKNGLSDITDKGENNA